MTKQEKSKYHLEIDRDEYKVVGHKFPDGYAIAIRQPIEFDLLKEQYPNAEMPEGIMEDSIAVDWRYAELEDGSLEQGVQLTIRTLNGVGRAELERFETQSIQYIMSMEKFEDLFNAMKKIKKKTPDLAAYRKDKTDREEQLIRQQAKVEEMVKCSKVRKEIAQNITNALCDVEEGTK